MGGAATVVCLQQLKGILGLIHFTHGTDLVSVLRSVFSQTHEWRWENALLGVCFLFYLLVARYISQKRPKLFWISAMALLTSVILGSVLVYLTHAEKHGVQVKKSEPVVWSIGSKKRLEDSSVNGLLVKVYSNGDVYEGEFYKGKCSGSGVYYYNLNGRYKGDLVDQKFYVGDLFAGEWFKGQCHGVGVHTCQDGSKFLHGKIIQVERQDEKTLEFRASILVEELLQRYPGAEAVVALSNHHYNYKLKSGNMYYLVPKSSQVSEPRVVNKDEDWGGCERLRIKVVITKQQLKRLVSNQISIQDVMMKQNQAPC
nr:sulfate transporter 3.1-like [Tanacetum cinerariifolium]